MKDKKQLKELRIRFSEDEYQLLCKQAEKLHLKPTALARMLLFHALSKQISLN